MTKSAFRGFRFCLLMLAVFLRVPHGLAQQNSDTPKISGQQALQRDGQQGFDFEIGVWKTHLKRLQHPLTGSNSWVEYDGTTVVRKQLSYFVHEIDLIPHKYLCHRLFWPTPTAAACRPQAADNAKGSSCVATVAHRQF